MDSLSLSALPLPLRLVGLALVDGLSVGTLLIPVLLLIAPGRPRVKRILLYLGTITLFYFLIGVLFTLGLINVIDVARGVLTSPAGQTALLVIGAVMLVTAICMPTPKARRQRARSARLRELQAANGPGWTPSEAELSDEALSASASDGRITRWRDRLLADETSRMAVVGVALAAGMIEIATMLPYLVGMTMIADEPISMPSRILMLAGYCAVMIAPALILLVVRVLAAHAIDGPLHRFAGWLRRTGTENTAWALGILGFLLMRSAAIQLGIDLPFIGGS